jgi:hypothetical protein
LETDKAAHFATIVLDGGTGTITLGVLPKAGDSGGGSSEVLAFPPQQALEEAEARTPNDVIAPAQTVESEVDTNMACTEIANAFDWAMQTVPGSTEFPVTAFLTRHSGVLSKMVSGDLRSGRDICRYAVGLVVYVPPAGTITTLGAVGYLAGELEQFSWNYGNPNDSESMEALSSRTIEVQIFSDGIVNFRDKLSGKVIGGSNFTKVTTTCVGGVLLTGSTDNEVIVLGLRRNPTKGKPG